MTEFQFVDRYDDGDQAAGNGRFVRELSPTLPLSFNPDRKGLVTYRKIEPTLIDADVFGPNRSDRALRSVRDAAATEELIVLTQRVVELTSELERSKQLNVEYADRLKSEAEARRKLMEAFETLRAALVPIVEASRLRSQSTESTSDDDSIDFTAFGPSQEEYEAAMRRELSNVLYVPDDL